VQEAACGALRNYMNIRGGKRNVCAENVGAVEAVVVAMHTHASVTSVQARACGALRNLRKGGAEAEENRIRAGEAGASHRGYGSGDACTRDRMMEICKNGSAGCCGISRPAPCETRFALSTQVPSRLS